MRQIVKRDRMMAAMAAMLVAVGRAMAQNEEQRRQPQRRIVISIPDRKLALIEDGKVVRIYPTAVGADATPSPTGSFTVIRRVSESHLVSRRQSRPSGQEQSGGQPLDRAQREGLRHPRHQRAGVDRTQRVARLHPNAESRRRTVIRTGEDRRRGGIARRSE